MARMHVLLYGAGGFIGQQILTFLQAQGFQHADTQTTQAHAAASAPHLLSDAAAVAVAAADSSRVWSVSVIRVYGRAAAVAELERVRPTHVLNCLGRTHGGVGESQSIDYLSSADPRVLDLNVRDNLYAATLLAALCQTRHIHYTYVGTSGMYAYDDTHRADDAAWLGFSESDEANYRGNAYAVVKQYADRQLRDLHAEVGEQASCILNLRLAMPISGDEHPRSLLSKLRSFRTLHGPLMANSITVLPSLLPAMLSLMQRRISGTVNFTNPGALDHAQLLSIYRDIVNPHQTWSVQMPAPQPAQPAAAAAGGQSAPSAPMSAVKASHRLDTRRLQQLCPDVPTLTEAVQMVCRSIHQAHTKQQQ